MSYFPPRSARLRLAPLVLAGLGLLIALGGCVSSQSGRQVALPRGHAEVTVTNLTPHLWQIALRAPESPEAVPLDVKAHETISVIIPAGDYVVEQTLVDRGSTPATRRFDARFDAGERYHWNLATLLAGSARRNL